MKGNYEGLKSDRLKKYKIENIALLYMRVCSNVISLY